MSGECSEQEIVTLVDVLEPLIGIDETDTEWKLGTFSLDKNYPGFRVGYGGVLTSQSRFRKQWFEAPSKGKSGWALIFREFDSSARSTEPQEFFVGWIVPEREADVDRWVGFLNQEVRDRLDGKAADRPPPTIGRVRSTTEMWFEASLLACPRCKTLEQPDWRLVGSRDVWSITAPCPRCELQRTHFFRSVGDPDGDHPLYELGGAEPSEVVTLAQFTTELDRLLPTLPEDPSALEPTAWWAAAERRDRALTCVNELLKFEPDRLDLDVLRARREQLLRLGQAFVDDAPRIWAQEVAAPPPIGAFDRESGSAHEEWLKTNGASGTRFVMERVDGRDRRLRARTFDRARWVDVNLDGADLTYTHLHDAELSGVTLVHARLHWAQLDGAKISGGSWKRATLVFAHLDKAELTDIDFSNAGMTRTCWPGTTVTRVRFVDADFGDATLDDARFVECDMHGARFSTIPGHNFQQFCTTQRARFESCDLRDTEWNGRDLSGAVFVRCQLAGAHGRPLAMTDVRVEECDLDLATLTERLVGRAKDSP